MTTDQIHNEITNDLILGILYKNKDDYRVVTFKITNNPPEKHPEMVVHLINSVDQAIEVINLIHPSDDEYLVEEMAEYIEQNKINILKPMYLLSIISEREYV